MYLLESVDDCVVFANGDERLRLAFVEAAILRVTATAGRPFAEDRSAIVVSETGFREFSVREDDEAYTLTTAELTIAVVKTTGAIVYRTSSGQLLFREPVQDGRRLRTKAIYRNIFSEDGTVDVGNSVDGVRASAESYSSVLDREAFEAELHFVFSEGEAIYGFGAHEEGYGNLRGRSRELYQQNMKAVVPCFVSTGGYGVLFNCGSLMRFHDDAAGASWWADVVEELDFYVFCGDDLESIYKHYFTLTGAAPMLPRWAFGYVQSKERYVNAAEIVAAAREYRRRKVPLDCLVLDWKSWPNGEGWGQKSFDATRFPSPQEMIDALHAMDVKLMLSIWPVMTGGCADQVELLAKRQMLGNRSTYDAFDTAARETYWNQANGDLFAHGVDAWWCDCTEPFEADWAGAERPDVEMRLAINTEAAKKYIDAAKINLYSLYHSRGIYEGQRTASDKRVVNLTRSSYAGQHRYGTITWNGDISATWETLRRSITEGLSFCASGEPYWTVDIGGFFIDSKPELWFWRGDYSEGCRGLTPADAMVPDPADTGCRDMGYWELYTRWLEYACFLPMMRSHGTDAAREIWCFGDVGSDFYEAIAKFIRLRYRLLPYVYSLAALVTRRGTPMLRAMGLQHPLDVRAHTIDDQFFLGAAMMVCPVVTPMLYGPGSQSLEGVAVSRSVYLPVGSTWYSFWTEERMSGGRGIDVISPLDSIPVFVRAGTIIPLAVDGMQHTGEIVDMPLILNVYTGADAAFELYEDAGDGYAYEQGEFSLTKMDWSEAKCELVLRAREGSYDGMPQVREYEVRFIGGETGVTSKHFSYGGAELRVSAIG